MPAQSRPASDTWRHAQVMAIVITVNSTHHSTGGGTICRSRPRVISALRTSDCAGVACSNARIGIANSQRASCHAASSA